MEKDTVPPKDPKRGYAPLYERFIPIALVIILIVIIGILLLTFGIALDLIPTA